MGTCALDDSHDSRADALLGLLEGLSLAGAERSIKLSPGGVLPHRFLVGVDVGDISRERLQAVLRTLAMPEEHLVALQVALPDANQVLFGYERNPEGAVYKAYLEFWDKLVRALRTDPKGRSPALLHVGYKWDPDDSARSTVSRYVCHPMLGERAIRGRLSGIYGEGGRRHGHAVVRDILRQATARAGDGRFIYVEVTDLGNPRNSFDLNLYKAGMNLGDIRDHVESLARAFALAPESVLPLVDRMAARPFGHLAGGIDRRGQEFLTVYCEV